MIPAKFESTSNNRFRWRQKHKPKNRLFGSYNPFIVPLIRRIERVSRFFFNYKNTCFIGVSSVNFRFVRSIDGMMQMKRDHKRNNYEIKPTYNIFIHIYWLSVTKAKKKLILIPFTTVAILRHAKSSWRWQKYDMSYFSIIAAKNQRIFKKIKADIQIKEADVDKKTAIHQSIWHCRESQPKGNQ